MDQELLRLTPALIVEDDPAMQLRLSRLIGEIDGGDGVTVVASLAEAYSALAARRFARVQRQGQDLPVLVISSWGHEDTVLSALQAGACGYLLKERDDVELTVSLRSIQRGGAPIDPVIARRILGLLPGARPADTTAAAPSDEIRLSAREQEVLQLLARGCSNREIAELVGLSRLTVEGYIKAIYRKLAVGSRTAAVFEAQKLGLLR